MAEELKLSAVKLRLDNYGGDSATYLMIGENILSSVYDGDAEKLARQKRVADCWNACAGVEEVECCVPYLEALAAHQREQAEGLPGVPVMIFTGVLGVLARNIGHKQMSPAFNEFLPLLKRIVAIYSGLPEADPPATKPAEREDEDLDNADDPNYGVP